MNHIIIKDANHNDILISRIIFGGSNIPFMKGKLPSDFLSTCLSHGLFTLDTARMYGGGKSEELIGSWIREYQIPRDQVTIITKCCHPAMGFLPQVYRKKAFRDIEASLKTLDLPYVDCLLLHRDDTRKRPEEIITFMNDILKKGYCRSIGVSNWKTERIKIANDYALSHNMVPFTLSEAQYSLGSRIKDPWHNGTVSITGVDNAKEREFYIQQDMPFLCFSSLGEGFFSGKVKADDPSFCQKITRTSKAAYYSKDNLKVLKKAEEIAKQKGCSVSTIALSYCLQQKIKMACIVSVSNEKRLMENMQALNVELTKEEVEYLSQ